MIPLRLELQNFMSYRDPCIVDLRDVSVACLSGDNGAGKSALLDAMTWALWGKSRAKSDRNLITLRETDMRVELDFRLGNQEYKIHRARTGASHRLTLELYVRRGESDEWEPITGDNASDTQRKIDALVRMDYDTFTNSAFLLQGQADAFTQKTPGERKRILGEILGLDEYDELASLARERDRDARQRAGIQRERIEELDRQIGQEQETKNALAETEETIAGLDRRLAEIERERQQIATEIELLKAIESTQQRAVERKTGLHRQREQITDHLAADERGLNEAESVLARAEEIERGFAALTSARERRDHFAEALRHRRPIEERIAQLSAEIEREQRQIEHDTQRRRDRRAQVAEQLKSREERYRELEKNRSELRELDQKLGAYGGVEQLRGGVQERIGALQAENKALRQQMNDIQERMQAIQEGEATCPVCRRPLAEGEHEHIKALWKQDGTKLGDAFRKNQADIEELRKQLAAHDTQIADQRDLQKRHTQLTTQVRQLEVEIEKSSELDAELKQIDQQIEANVLRLESNDFAKEQRQKLEAAQRRLAELPYDPDEHQKVQDEVARLEPFDRDNQLLVQARERVKTLGESIEERKKRRDEIDGELRQVEEELAEHEERLTRADETREKYKQVQEAYGKLQGERTQFADKRALLQAELSKIESLRDERRTAQATVRQLSQDADAYRELNEAFGRNGIQAMIINNVIPEIQEEANALLRRMSSSMLEVRIDTSRLGRSNQQIDTLDITIHDEFGQRPYEMYSGGEAFRIDFAIRVALSQLLARRAGATIDLLVIDEGFGTQDARGRDGLVEALHSVQDDFDMLLVITHIDEIRDMFPTRIDVVKTPSGSRVTVN